MSLEEFKNIEDLYKAKTFGTIHSIRTHPIIPTSQITYCVKGLKFSQWTGLTGLTG